MQNFLTGVGNTPSRTCHPATSLWKIAPLIDDLVLTLAGEPHIAKITALSSSFVALIIIGCCITCYKCDGYRNFFTDILKKCIPSQARRAFIKKKLEGNLTMLELTSKLEDREMQRIIKIKEESNCKPEFEISKIEKVDQIERGEKEKHRKHSRSRSRSLQSKGHKSIRCSNGIKHCQCDRFDPGNCIGNVLD